jgi:SagB-type dehydrogenase family enzyme
MRLYIKYLLLITATVVIILAMARFADKKQGNLEGAYAAGGLTVKLPIPHTSGKVSVEEALALRRSVREYANEPLTLDEVSQLLWSAQGVNAEWGGRTAPSAGATYPLETYLVAGEVSNLKPGVYHYLPHNHSLEPMIDGDVRDKLADAALRQTWVAKAPVSIVFAADYVRTTRVYGERGRQYVHMEAGHAAENVYLQCASLGCGTVAVGAFDDESVKEVLQIPAGQEPLYIMPVGKV